MTMIIKSTKLKLRSIFSLTLFAFFTLFSATSFAQDEPSQLIDPGVYVTSPTNQEYLLSWKVSNIDLKTNESVLASSGVTEVSGPANNKKVGNFDWLIGLNKSQPVNAITVILTDKDGKKIISIAQSISENLFADKDKSLDEKLNLFVSIDDHQRLTIYVSDEKPSK